MQPLGRLSLASTALVVLTACGAPPSGPSAPARPTVSASESPAPTGSASGEPASAAPTAPEATDVPDAGVDAATDDAAVDPDAAVLASTSLGGPSTGRLEGAVALPEHAPGLVSNPRRPNATAFYGTRELVEALVAAAAVVDHELPGSALYVNDIGFREGGPIDHHGSHQAGRDVDILFYLLDAHGEPAPSIGVPIDPEGLGTDYRDLLDPDDDVPLRLDVRRTWRFVHALLEVAPSVQRVFVVEHVRTMLLEEARRRRAPRAIVQRFEEVTCQPSYAHDDHLHVRFFCSDEDLALGCADGPPMYPWRRAELRAAGIEPVAEQRARRRSGRVTTEAEARAAMPPMHASVRAFLDRRATWTTQPHPGRTYCR